MASSDSSFRAISQHRRIEKRSLLVIARDYVAHKDSESPDSRYGVLVLSHEAAVDKDQTEGNTTYVANL
jgi:hypothetical protein